MKRAWWLAGAALAVCSTLALAAPESLLPPGFDNPTPTPTPAPRASAAPAPSSTSAPVIQPLPVLPGQEGTPNVTLPANFPSIDQLEKMDPDQLDELFGLKPRYDIPPGAQRGELDRVHAGRRIEPAGERAAEQDVAPARDQRALGAGQGRAYQRGGLVDKRAGRHSAFGRPDHSHRADDLAVRLIAPPFNRQRI